MTPMTVLPRYIAAGAVNTALTYLLYLLLLPQLGYRVAYVLAFMAGMAISYVLLRFAVFRVPGRRFSVVWVAASHVVQLGVGLLAAEIWVRALHGPPALAALAAVAVSLPITYLMQRWVFSRKRAG